MFPARALNEISPKDQKKLLFTSADETAVNATE